MTSPWVWVGRCGVVDKDLAVEVDGKLMEWESDGAWYDGKKIESAICRTFKEPVKAGPHSVTLTAKTCEDHYMAIASIIYQ